MQAELPDSTPETDTNELPSAPAARDTAERGAVYELFVLGELMGRPLHGYVLREILNNIFGPFRQISWGALYPLIRRLEQAGAIAPAPATAGAAAPGGQGPGRPRHSYAITEAGRARFYVLMAEGGAYNADTPELFLLKLNYWGAIPLAQQLAVLRHFRGYLQIEAAYLEGAEQRVPARAAISAAERAHILRMLRFRLSGVLAQRAWVDAELARRDDPIPDAPAPADPRSPPDRRPR